MKGVNLDRPLNGGNSVNLMVNDQITLTGSDLIYQDYVVIMEPSGTSSCPETGCRFKTSGCTQPKDQQTNTKTLCRVTQLGYATTTIFYKDRGQWILGNF